MLNLQDFQKIVSPQLSSRLSAVEQIAGGRNSRVFKLLCEDSKQYAIKFYFQHSSDSRNRLQIEFLALQFLWENELHCVPQPVIADENQRWAIYEYIDGKKIAAQDITQSDIEHLVQFLNSLKELKTNKNSASLSSASEACFSIQEIVENIHFRLKRLRDGEEKYMQLKTFISQEFVPTLKEIIEWCQSSLNQYGLTWVGRIEEKQKTLSPSDYGFHNLLKRKDGEIIYLDFEYFGWDDPAKMISDFLLHPEMDIRIEFKQWFTQAMLSCFEQDRFLPKRLATVYPLFGLKWCLILLNEFLPHHLLRRGFASPHPIAPNLQNQQLAKAERMLYSIRNQYQQFPYY